MLFMITACNNETSKDDSSNTDTTKKWQHAEAVLTGTVPDTSVSGTVNFDEQSNGKIKMKLQLTVPLKSNQTVAVHIHEHGDCGDKGEHAGGHWNPAATNHGKWGSAGFHSGDIGNIRLNAEGKSDFELETDLWSIGGDAKTDILGKTIIIHSGVDDYTTQPTGNSGSRIGCAVIRKKE
jgi:superoxide dismutase, Cu-Zn family